MVTEEGVPNHEDPQKKTEDRIISKIKRKRQGIGEPSIQVVVVKGERQYQHFIRNAKKYGQDLQPSQALMKA